MATPSSRQVFKSPNCGSSISVVKGEYSIWTAEMGWMAWARRSEAEEISEKPRYLILPSLDKYQLMIYRLIEAVRERLTSLAQPWPAPSSL